jgi:hypothetical protein
MIRLANMIRPLDAGVHATHSSMVIGHDLHELVRGHISLEVILAAYVLVRLAIEPVRLAGKGIRRPKAYRLRRKEACDVAGQAASAPPPPTSV